MNIRYFEDADTDLLEFSAVPPVETRELSEAYYVNSDAKGRLVSMTVEPASERASLGEVNFRPVEKSHV